MVCSASPAFAAAIVVTLILGNRYMTGIEESRESRAELVSSVATTQAIDQTSMTDVTQLIRVALKSKDAIPRQHIRQWIKNADTVAVEALLYELTRDAWNRIQPTLERDETCALIQGYLLRCIRENPTDGLALTRYEAAAELEGWFDRLAAREDTHDIAQRVAGGGGDPLFGGGPRPRG